MTPIIAKIARLTHLTHAGDADAADALRRHEERSGYLALRARAAMGDLTALEELHKELLRRARPEDTIIKIEEWIRGAFGPAYHSEQNDQEVWLDLAVGRVYSMTKGSYYPADSCLADASSMQGYHGPAVTEWFRSPEIQKHLIDFIAEQESEESDLPEWECEEPTRPWDRLGGILVNCFGQASQIAREMSESDWLDYYQDGVAWEILDMFESGLPSGSDLPRTGEGVLQATRELQECDEGNGCIFGFEAEEMIVEYLDGYWGYVDPSCDERWELLGQLLVDTRIIRQRDLDETREDYLEELEDAEEDD